MWSDVRIPHQGEPAQIQHLNHQHEPGEEGGNAGKEQEMAAIQLRGAVKNFAQAQRAELLLHGSLAMRCGSPAAGAFQPCEAEETGAG